MTKVSNNAFVVMAFCNSADKAYGITVDKIANGYSFIWAFKINREKAHREGYDSTTVTGSIATDAGYPGCPYCRGQDFYVCGSCEKVVCYNGERVVTCPSCGNKGEVTRVESITIKGGGY